MPLWYQVCKREKKAIREGIPKRYNKLWNYDVINISTIQKKGIPKSLRKRSPKGESKNVKNKMKYWPGSALGQDLGAAGRDLGRGVAQHAVPRIVGLPVSIYSLICDVLVDAKCYPMVWPFHKNDPWVVLGTSRGHREKDGCARMVPKSKAAAPSRCTACQAISSPVLSLSRPPSLNPSPRVQNAS